MCVTFGECLGVTEMKYIYIYIYIYMRFKPFYSKCCQLSNSLEDSKVKLLISEHLLNTNLKTE